MTIKPYIFNNYEKSLPEQHRGQYRAVPVSKQSTKTKLEKSNGIMMTVDLTDVKDKTDVRDRFYTKFDFSKGKGPGSWDALGDYLWFFPESSSLFYTINPAVVHIRVKNLNHVWTYSESDYSILCEILIATTDNSRFDDGFRIIVEVING